MSNILNRLKNLENERPAVLRTAEPVLSRSHRSQKKSGRFTLILFAAIVVACSFLTYQYKEQFLPTAVTPTAPVVDASQIQNQKNDSAIEAYARGDYKQSSEILEALVKAHPERAEFHLNLAMTYQQLGKFDNAQEQLNLAIALDPKDSYAQNNLGLPAMQTKQQQLAEKSFAKAYELNPKSPEITLNLASFYEKSNRLSQAVQVYQQFIALPKAEKKTVELVKKRLPRLNALSAQQERGLAEEGS